ncbi:unnamed protein product [Rhizophagus irregularis]|nr:unnamed protein product [Rhizophagus irregularis]
MDKGNETQVPIETEFINLNISDKDSSSVNINDKNCSYCNKPFIEELWCKECDPRRMFEGWTSGNNDIGKFIKDTIYDARNGPRAIFLEWVPFDRFEDVKEIGVGGFAKVYSATWIDGKAEYDYGWKRKEPQPIKVALKRLNGSKNMSAEYLNELKINWDYYFGLSGPSTKQKSDDKICGVMPYVAPEVLNGEPYSLSSDIYSFGIIMTELSSGKPPFYKRKHDTTLALEICNGLRPEFGKGTPEIYKKLAYKCMNANSNQRPTASELFDIIQFWHYSSIKKDDYQEKEKFGYKGKEIKAMFEEADKEIPNISTSYEINPDAIYTSRVFTFSNLTKPVNSSIITSYLDEENNEDCKDSKLFDLEVSSSLQLKDDISNKDDVDY